MHLPEIQPDELTDLATRLRGLSELIVQHCAKGETLEVADSADIFAGQPQQQLYALIAGQVQLERKGKPVLVFEPGDLLGLSRSLQLAEGKLIARDAQLTPILRDDLMAHVNSSAELQQHWAYYLIGMTTFFREAFATEKRASFQPSTGFMHFAKDDVIIEQGSAANCVYTLLEGSAVAMRDGIKVGDVNAEEIFGAMAVFTRQTRTASVVATSDCTVMAVRKEDFIDLVENQPQVCISLIEEMADKIHQLNQLVTSAS